jgi:hypothetical protein
MKGQKGLRAHPLVDSEWDQAASLIPVDLETTARGEKALRRRRQICSATDLLRLVLAYSLCDWPLCLVGAWGVLIGIGQLSDVAVLKRLRLCLTWLGKLIVAWMIQRQMTLIQRPVRLRLVDATTISQPGSNGIDWRIHLTLNLGMGSKSQMSRGVRHYCAITPNPVTS